MTSLGDGDDRDQHLSGNAPLRPLGNGIVGYTQIAGGDGSQEDLIPIYRRPNDADTIDEVPRPEGS